MPDKKIRASVIGVSGYTGLELARLLMAHPQIGIKYLTARVDHDTPMENLYPHLAGYGLTITNTDLDTVAKDSDIVFLALPHKTAQDVVATLYGKTKIIDLSADYRLDDTDVYEHYYGLKHNHPDILKRAVYGAPEFHRDAIKKADLVANPGCFALLGQLLLYPLAGQIQSADIFAITGSSGAGKTPTDGTHHPVRNHNIKSYNINAHRHIPEITRTAKIKPDQLNFIPSSGPFTRGIFMQAFIQTIQSFDPNIYKHEPFIRTPQNVALANIIGSNFVDLSFIKGHDGRVIAQGALDNLVKGAAGCALQNMNLMFGLNEADGLKTLAPVYP